MHARTNEHRWATTIQNEIFSRYRLSVQLYHIEHLIVFYHLCLCNSPSTFWNFFEPPMSAIRISLKEALLELLTALLVILVIYWLFFSINIVYIRQGAVDTVERVETEKTSFQKRLGDSTQHITMLQTRIKELDSQKEVSWILSYF